MSTCTLHSEEDIQQLQRLATDPKDINEMAEKIIAGSGQNVC